MKKKQFEKLIKFFENNDIILIIREKCHHCNKYHEEDLSKEWLYDRLVKENTLKGVEKSDNK